MVKGMKIIDLLAEKASLATKVTDSRVTSCMQVVDGTSENEHKRYREYQQDVKRFNEICDDLNSAYSRTRISVPMYGDISLATALDYLRARCDGNRMCIDGAELETLLVDSVDFKYLAVNKVYLSTAFVDDDEDTTCACAAPHMGFGMGVGMGVSKPKKREYDKDFLLNSYNELKVAIMKAITETDV